MHTSTEIRNIFSHTDMDNLKQKLKLTLSICSQVASQEPGCERYLEHLGRVHGNLEIREEHYRLWLESLIASARQCDPEFTPAVEQAWRETIGQSIKILLSHAHHTQAS